MALKRSKGRQQDQLDLFSGKGNSHEHVDAIRLDGGTTLAGAPAADGGGNGADGHPPADVAGRGGADQGRNAHDAPATDPAGADTATGPRPSVGDGPGEIRSPAAGERLGVPRNLANYRITDHDRLGEGSLKQK